MNPSITIPNGRTRSQTDPCNPAESSGRSLRAEPQLIQEVDWSSDPFFHETLRGYASVMAIPFAGDRLPMTWVILLERPPERFTVLDLETAVERVALVGFLLENQILAEQLARANERIDRDARQVGELQ